MAQQRFRPPVSWDVEHVDAFDVWPSMSHRSTRHPSSGLGDLVSTPPGCASTPSGCDEIYLHHVGQEQEAFIDAFGEHVLPQVGVTVPAPATTDRVAVEREEAGR